MAKRKYDSEYIKLSRFYELRAEIAAFLSQNNSPLADVFSSKGWLALVAYLTDIFEHLNMLNVSVQGRGHNILEQRDKIDAFKKKISLWINHVSNKRLDMFPNACYEQQQLDAAGKKTMTKTISTHLNKLFERFSDYFPDKQPEDDWVRDPFGINMESITLPSSDECQLVELSCDRTLRKKFTEARGKGATEN
ncbi:zinc finger BED domain-containing protein 5-like [Amphiprion ocellaris]|uniref:zinc finger BED domain-containing protein 5-like n=1 Tax=Amphiprion ocellaris TaxID=80972 RepID=UPI00241188CF|nr:zinc finger BED domain-containing protein 5-like [Amphiprion ocellaris]